MLIQCDGDRISITFIIRGTTVPLYVRLYARLNASSDPWAVFEEIRQIRLAAERELGKHLNKTVDVVYRQLNAPKSIEEAVNMAASATNTEQLRRLMRARNLLIE